VVELAIRCVAGAGVVPGARALERRAVKRLDHRDVEPRLEFLQKDAERGAHDAGTHEDDVRLADRPIFNHGLLRSEDRLALAVPKSAKLAGTLRFGPQSDLVLASKFSRSWAMRLACRSVSPLISARRAINSVGAAVRSLPPPS